VESDTTSRTYRWVVWLAVIAPLALVLSSSVAAAAVLPGCVHCHEKDGPFRDQTRASTHAGVGCAACHVPSGYADRLGFGFRQVFHMAFPGARSSGREWAGVGNDECLKCHRAVGQGVVQANGIRVDHAACTVDSECVDCHSTVAHGTATGWPRTYDMETCLECHTENGISDCDLCHVGRRPQARITSGVFAVTHGPDWRKTHGMGNSATCAACHTAATCRKCHGPGLPHDAKFIETHGRSAVSSEAKCSGCHENRFCEACHGIAMPHSPAFTRNHAGLGGKRRAVCARCHADSDCVNCHVTHVHPGGAVDMPSLNASDR